MPGCIKENGLNSFDDKTCNFNLIDYKTKGKVVSVYDGDSIKIVFKLFKQGYFKWNCRLEGIDTPEFKTRDKEIKKYGTYVRDLLREKILNKIVSIKCGDFDKFGRLLVKIYTKNECVNNWLLNNNYAVEYHGFKKQNIKWSDMIKINNNLIENKNRCSIIKSKSNKKKPMPVLGILRLDYDYPPAPGDIDHPDTFNYDVLYRVIPGLTFEMCQSGNITDEVKENCITAVKYLESENVSGITGDCGFMINIQELVANNTYKPVFLSSLIQLPTIINTLNKKSKIAVFTANSNTLEPIKCKLNDMCGLSSDKRLTIIGCQDIPGFEAVAKGEKVDTDKVSPGIVSHAKYILQKDPYIKCILLECTELPPYADALRSELGIPVYDAITNCDSFMSGYLDNANFGLNNWQSQWDGKQDEYVFGDNLTIDEKKKLIN